MPEKTENSSKKTLTLKTLTLKRPAESEQVRQSFAHGKSKPVTVEVRKKRVLNTLERQKQEETPSPTPSDVSESSEAEALSAKKLTEGEMGARLRAVQEALRQEALDAEERSKKKEEKELKFEEHSKEESREITIPEAITKEVPPPKPILEKNLLSKGDKTSQRSRDFEEEEEEEQVNRRKASVKSETKRAVAVNRRELEQQPRKLTKQALTRALEDQEMERIRSIASLKRAQQKYKKNQIQTEPAKIVREVIIPETIGAGELANRMAVRGAEVVKTLMKLGIMATINQIIDADTAELVCTEFGHKVKRVLDSDIEIGLKGEEDSFETLQSRPAVVTVMGHVDHGKTSLLDALRQTDIASAEAGGITQHIGAYQVTLETGQKITFIDTPGHAAFTEMRARGAHVTDIVILVVAADDGIMEQTIEAINHAKAANVSIIVAINKIDKPEANPDRVRNELLNHGLVLEEFGGEVLSVEVSARKRIGLEKLTEALLLQAEILELKANPHRAGSGVVIEAKIDRGRGIVATVLVQNGTLQVGGVFVAGAEWGKVRALIDDHGKKIDKAGPSTPVEILGFDGIPLAGDEFVVVDDESKAREIAEYRQKRQKETRAAASVRTSMEQMMTKIAAGETKELGVVIKSDVHGSLEAISTSLAKLGNQEVAVNVLHGGVGSINESDVVLARASGGIIIGFNVRANPQARELARKDDVDIRYYSIIYNVIDDIKAMMSGLLSPTVREKYLGSAEIREVFIISKVGKVAGCYVIDGIVKRGAKVRLLRDNIVIHEGTLKTLRRFKDEVKEVKDSYECGMAFEHYNDIRVGDVIECFEMEQITRQL